MKKIAKIMILSLFISTNIPSHNYSMEQCLKGCLGGCWESIKGCCKNCGEKSWLQIKIGAKHLLTKLQKVIAEKTKKLINDIPIDDQFGNIFEQGTTTILKEKAQNTQLPANQTMQTTQVMQLIDQVVEKNRKNFVLVGKEAKPENLFQFLRKIQNEIRVTIGNTNLTPELSAYITSIIIENLKNYSNDLMNATTEQIAMHLLNNLQIQKRSYLSRDAQKYVDNQEEQIREVNAPEVPENELRIFI
jgi:hypothetical protein